jgi:CRP/FNR family transcriptional regulator, cyclic AMP receptor protein
VHFWNMLGETTKQAIRSAANVRKYKPGAVVINEGERSGWVLVLIAGRVKVVSSTENGYDAVLGVREPGDIIGEMAAVDGNPRSASVIAVDDVTALGLPAGHFARLQREPDVASALLRIISGRLRKASLRRAEYGDRSTAGRLADLLHELVQHYGKPTADGVLITLPVSQQELAGLIGASRETVARVLRELRDEGILTTGRQKIVVHRPDELRRRSTS